MRKLVVILMMVIMAWAGLAQAYTINDPVGDQIGDKTFDSFGINLQNYFTGPMVLDIFTNFPQQGLLVGSWATKPADVFIKETYMGNDYLWAIPLVSHDTFSAGYMYAVGSFRTSDDMAPPGGGYIFNHNVPVQIATLGTNYNGIQSFFFGNVTWNALSNAYGPLWDINISGGTLYQDDPLGKYAFIWGTGDCANDPVYGSVPASQVPVPPSFLLLGSGILGMGLLGWRRQQLPQGEAL